MAERRREEESSLRGYEHEFARAAEQLKVEAAGGRVFVSDPQKIKLYALYKQATDGDCTKPQPMMELVPSFKMPVEEEEQQQPIEEVDEEEEQPAKAVETDEDADVVPVGAPVVAEQQPRAQVVRAPLVRQPSQPQPQPWPMHRRVPPLVPRERKQPVAASSYAAICAQLVLFIALGVGFLCVATRIVLPFCHEQIAQQFGANTSKAIIKSMAPVLWFALGYLLVASLRSKTFSWRLLSGEFVWLRLASPRRAARPARLQQRVRRVRHWQAEPQLSPTEKLLEAFGIQVVDEPTSNDDSLVTPRLELVLPENPDAMGFGDSVTEFRFPLEQTVDVYYRKFKEPLPDLESPSKQLVAIELLDEHHFDEYDAVFRRRKLQFRNNVPYLIKRQFANSEFIEYIEDSLLDKRNRMFYVYTRNETFQSVGVIEDFSVYRVAPENAGWTQLTQGARLHLTSSSIGFLRSKIESLVASTYAKEVPLTRAYHEQRLCEEFGNLAGAEE
ncbi:Vacuolar protein, partial [Globisporangium splendens]